MNIDEAMAVIAEEAERQGFQVRQLPSGVWHLRKGNDNWTVAPSTIDALLDILRTLIAAGLDWSHRWD